ncbi:hypothetical protein [Amycolatopsis sp. NPDC004378]
MLIVWQGAGLVVGCVLVGLFVVAMFARTVLWARNRVVDRQRPYPDYEETLAQKRVRTMRLRDQGLDATQPIPRDPGWTR